MILVSGQVNCSRPAGSKVARVRFDGVQQTQRPISLSRKMGVGMIESELCIQLVHLATNAIVEIANLVVACRRNLLHQQRLI